ncbi:hypothetical protein CCP3SC1_30070 [Gammaproteobacteria bacterium]
MAGIDRKMVETSQMVSNEINAIYVMTNKSTLKEEEWQQSLKIMRNFFPRFLPECAGRRCMESLWWYRPVP